MDAIKHILDFFLHLDHHLTGILNEYGSWTYLIVFAIIFCETGLVVTPFLPGDSLLFVLGTLAASGMLDLGSLILLLSIAAILGDTVNYGVGHMLAPKIFRNEKIRFIKKEHLNQTKKFFEKYGGKTIIIARFVPIVRTFAPFMAGVGAMKYPKFLLYNIAGGVLWIVIFLVGGYFFGNIPFIKKNLTPVVFVIIFLSILPAVIEYFRHKKQSSK